MTTSFQMPPPNELLNTEPISLDEIIYSIDESTTPRTIIRINRLYKGDDLIRPVLWNGRLFTLMCFDNTKLISLLEQLHEQSWPIAGRNKLAACLEQLFNDFITNHRYYMDWWYSITLTEREAVRIKAMYVPLRDDVAKVAKQSFTKVLPIVVAWAMADFSRDVSTRHNWRWIKEVPECEIVDIGKIKLEEQAEEERKEKRVVAVSAEELLNRKRMKALRLKVARMRKQGLIDEEVVEMLEM